jgi:tetratricopeptide (TPR) repeat protein
MDFAARFKEARVGAGLSQSAVSRPQYTVSYISQIEAGRRIPAREALDFFAGRLGVSADYLLTGVPEGIEDALAYKLESANAELRKGRAERAREAIEQILAESARLGLERVRSRALVALGEVLAVSGRHREAIDRLEEALEAQLSARDEVLAVSRLSRCYRELGDLAYARDVVESFLSREDRAPLDPGLAAELQAVLISIYFERGDMTLAERAAERALAAADQGIDLRIRANAAWDAARVMAESSRWDEALDLAVRARTLMEELDQRRDVGRLHVSCAFICLEAEPPRLEEAKQHLRIAEERLSRFGAPEDLGFVWSELGRVLLLEGNPDEAIRQIDKALPRFGGFEGEIARCLRLKGIALFDLGRLDEARSSLSQAVDLFARTGARQEQASCYRELGEIDLRQGKVEEAVTSLQAGLDALGSRTRTPLRDHSSS